MTGEPKLQDVAALRVRPIIFSTAMVRAILYGKKTQTRRILRDQPDCFSDPAWFEGDGHSGRGWYCAEDEYRDEGSLFYECPYGVAGDVLYVREAWRAHELEDGTDGILFRADDAFVPIVNSPEAAAAWAVAWNNGKHRDRWRPSIHMPKWAARMRLELTAVGVEQLCSSALNAAAVVAEGIEVPDVDYTVCDDPRALDYERDGHARDQFRELWDGLNAKRGYGWDTNPWVWVLEFRRAEP